MAGLQVCGLNPLLKQPTSALSESGIELHPPPQMMIRLQAVVGSTLCGYSLPWTASVSHCLHAKIWNSKHCANALCYSWHPHLINKQRSIKLCSATVYVRTAVWPTPLPAPASEKGTLCCHIGMDWDQFRQTIWLSGETLFSSQAAADCTPSPTNHYKTCKSPAYTSSPNTSVNLHQGQQGLVGQHHLPSLACQH